MLKIENIQDSEIAVTEKHPNGSILYLIKTKIELSYFA